VNILDENVLADQRELLQHWKIPFRQIGHEVGWSGMTDEEIVPLLRSLRRPTLFTLDTDFYDRELVHARYGLVCLDVQQSETALFIRRVLRHSSFDTQAKRLGVVMRVMHTGVVFWRLHAQRAARVAWKD
jgi:hypothetical protein